MPYFPHPANLEIFKPSSQALPSVLSAVSSGGYDEEFQAFDKEIEGISEWEAVVTEIESGVAHLKAKAAAGRALSEANFGIVEWTLDLGTASLPAAWALMAVNKVIGLQKSIVIDGIAQQFSDASQRLTEVTISRLVNDTGQTYVELFSSSNPQQTAVSIQRAKDLLSDKLNDLPNETKAIVLEKMVDTLTNVIQSNQTPPDRDPSDESIKKAGTQAEKSIETVKRVVKSEVDKSEKLRQVTEAIEDKLQIVATGGQVNAADNESLLAVAEQVIEISSVAPQVLSAAVALGLPPESAENINLGVQVATNVATGYLAAFSNPNPMMAVGAAANLISIAFGGGKDAATQRHEQIMKAIGFLAKQNQAILDNQRTILNNQRRIYRAVKAVAHNQTVIIELELNTLKEVLRNREFLIDITTGPILKLEGALKSERFRTGTGAGKDLLGYDQVRELFVNRGDLLGAGVDHLERVFRDPNNLHAVLKQDTFTGASEVEIELQSEVTRFRRIDSDLSMDTFATLDAQYQQKRASFLDMSLSLRMVSEYATWDGVITGDDIGFTGEHLWADTLPAHWISADILLRLGHLAAQSHALFQFITGESGSFALRGLDDIANDPRQSHRGRELLINVLILVNRAIAQRILLNDEIGGRIIELAQFLRASDPKSALPKLEDGVLTFIFNFLATQAPDLADAKRCINDIMSIFSYELREQNWTRDDFDYHFNIYHAPWTEEAQEANSFQNRCENKAQARFRQYVDSTAISPALKKSIENEINFKLRVHSEGAWIVKYLPTEEACTLDRNGIYRLTTQYSSFWRQGVTAAIEGKTIQEILGFSRISEITSVRERREAKDAIGNWFRNASFNQPASLGEDVRMLLQLKSLLVEELVGYYPATEPESESARNIFTSTTAVFTRAGARIGLS